MIIITIIIITIVGIIIGSDRIGAQEGGMAGTRVIIVDKCKLDVLNVKPL